MINASNVYRSPSSLRINRRFHAMDTATTSDKDVYEVQQLRNGDWSCVCSYFSQTEAVDEVKTMVERNQDV